MSTSAVRRKVKSSRDRNDNGAWGFQPSTFSNRLHQKMKKDVERGIIPASALRVSMVISGRKPLVNTPKAGAKPAKISAPILAQAAAAVGGLFRSFRRNGSRGSK
jgi:hypothetical protein